MSQRLNCPEMWSIETLFCYYNQNISKSNFRNDVISAILAKNLFLGSWALETVRLKLFMHHESAIQGRSVVYSYWC